MTTKLQAPRPRGNATEKPSGVNVAERPRRPELCEGDRRTRRVVLRLQPEIFSKLEAMVPGERERTRVISDLIALAADDAKDDEEEHAESDALRWLVRARRALRNREEVPSGAPRFYYERGRTEHLVLLLDLVLRTLLDSDRGDWQVVARLAESARPKERALLAVVEAADEALRTVRRGRFAAHEEARHLIDRLATDPGVAESDRVRLATLDQRRVSEILASCVRNQRRKDAWLAAALTIECGAFGHGRADGEGIDVARVRTARAFRTARKALGVDSLSSIVAELLDGSPSWVPRNK